MLDLTFEEYMTKIILPAFRDTFTILFYATSVALVLGTALAIILAITNENGLHPCKPVYKVLDFITNTVRSFPFVILVVTVIPFTRWLMGTSIGIPGAVVPLIIGMTPFVGRLIENCLMEVDKQVIEAARSFGASDFDIIFRVMLVEAVPGISNSIVFTVIQALGATAQAGMVGAGGLGTVAIRYGYNNFNDVIMYSTVLILLVLVQAIQLGGRYIYKKLK